MMNLPSSSSLPKPLIEEEEEEDEEDASAPCNPQFLCVPNNNNIFEYYNLKKKKNIDWLVNVSSFTAPEVVKICSRPS